ncbi:pilus assembly FimT family protein [Pleionea sediminis]|uniref:pilus assembly FimT family protein n=1 Tax=Pleionea sediminis TaxID=2569479 RepID=UPI0013DE2721|nr:prepilin-type N-terminal cleavage/methylation domain-containing protein [Pleionea sediminis]
MHLDIRKPPAKQAAFSLFELVIVIIIVGILAAVVAPRFGSDQSFESRAAGAELVNRLRFAQQLALSNTSRTVSVAISATSLNIQQDGTSLSGYPFDFSNSYDVEFSASNLVYNSLGETTSTTISITPSAGLSVCVETSGFAWLC